MLEHLCIQEKERERRQSCVWRYTVLGILCGLREAGRAKRQLRGEEACRETVLGRAGYRESSRESSSESSRESIDKGFGQWIRERYCKGRLVGQICSKGIGSIIEIVLEEEEVNI